MPHDQMDYPAIPVGAPGPERSWGLEDLTMGHQSAVESQVISIITKEDGHQPESAREGVPMMTSHMSNKMTAKREATRGKEARSNQHRKPLHHLVSIDDAAEKKTAD